MDEVEFSRVTTRGGDHGESSLSDGERRRKDDLLFHTLGSLDELISHLGVVRALCSSQEGVDIDVVQRRLQILSGLVAVPRRGRVPDKAQRIEEKDLEELERWERLLMDRTSIPNRFIQPGDSLISANIHVARAVCRRAERWLVGCIRDKGMDHLIPGQRYLNRLSDYLFVLALWWDQNKF